MKQSWKAMMRGAPSVFCWQTFSADSFAIAPEFATKACAMFEWRAASCTMISVNSTQSALNCRLPCITVSDSADSSAARTISGSPCPNMCTPMPLIMSHFTEPSTSSTSGPLPAPEPT